MYTNANGISGKDRIDGYSWFTRNRKKNQGGGVAIVVRNDLISKVRTIDKVENENIEILWVEIKTGKNNKKPSSGYILWPTRK